MGRTSSRRCSSSMPALPTSPVDRESCRDTKSSVSGVPSAVESTLWLLRRCGADLLELVASGVADVRDQLPSRAVDNAATLAIMACEDRSRISMGHSMLLLVHRRGPGSV